MTDLRGAHKNNKMPWEGGDNGNNGHSHRKKSEINTIKTYILVMAFLGLASCCAHSFWMHCFLSNAVTACLALTARLISIRRDDPHRLPTRFVFRNALQHLWKVGVALLRNGGHFGPCPPPRPNNVARRAALKLQPRTPQWDGRCAREHGVAL